MASAARAARAAARGTIGLVTRSWPRHSRLFLVGEGSGWVIDHELAALSSTASALGYRVADPRLLRASRDQCAFYGSQFTLLVGPWSPPPHRLGAAYFHGLPGTPGMPEFDECFRTLCEHHRELERLQVSHREIEELVLSSGIDPAKVFRIPIGIEGSYFHPPEPRRRDELRAELGFPPPAFVVGCFQKDGVGWGDGRQPKEIKGPDVLLQALELLRERVPELHVLLSGPARGFVRTGLERLAIPYVHRKLESYDRMADLYGSLDAYVVPSRQEGGPKGVLEAMACGVPVVSTRVGQAPDLVAHGENGWLVPVEDAEGLARWLAHVAARPPELLRVVDAGLRTAAANTYEAQRPLWDELLTGFLART